MNALGWALGRALEYAAATAVVGLVAATVFTGSESERLATTAYVAAIVAAAILALKWFLPKAPQRAPEARFRGPLFPAFFAFAVAVLALLTLVGALVAQPGAEILAVLFCFGLIGLAALVRGGAPRLAHAKLLSGGRLPATTRYAVVVATAALAATALFSSSGLDGPAKLAYIALVVAAVAVGASLLGQTGAGAFVAAKYARSVELFRTPRGAYVFARTREYAIASAVVALLLAAVLPGIYAERFASTAYVAALFAAFAIAANWRLASAGLRGTGSPIAMRRLRPLTFAAVVAALVAVGAAVAFNPIAEALAVCAGLCVIAVAILNRTGAFVVR